MKNKTKRIIRKEKIKQLFIALLKESGVNFKVKLLIVENRNKPSYHKCSYRRATGEITKSIISINLLSLKKRVREGYSSKYYDNRPLFINSYVVKNRKNTIRFIMFHEIKHAIDMHKLRNKRFRIKVSEKDADDFAINKLNKKGLKWKKGTLT